ncbi:MAG: glycosyltransferase family 39 protein [Pyrinomonadaceae bacterium]
MRTVDRNQILYILCPFVAVVAMVINMPEGLMAVGLGAVLVFIVIHLIRNHEDGIFLQQVFLTGLLPRIIFASFIFSAEAYAYFGGDAQTYDFRARVILQVLFGTSTPADVIQQSFSTSGSGWGMNWFVAFIYLLVGQNLFAVMIIECVIGASTALLIYRIVMEIYNNRRAARIAAWMVALFPAMIIWSSQALKDGITVFLLVLMMICIIELQKKLNLLYTFLLFSCLFGILSLRFYIFYMAAIAVTGSFLIGTSNTFKQMLQRLTAFATIGLILMYIGAINTANANFDKYGTLEAVQRSRGDLAISAGSGYGKDLDVSTTEGAVVALPIGFTYLMLAPFPWEVRNVRQALVVPESLVWWCLMPFLGIGLWYTIKHRWRNAVAILIFTFMLTFAYSIFQGNVGTAYRQRTQIQVFLFIFIAVGIVIQREKAENRQISIRR